MRLRNRIPLVWLAIAFAMTFAMSGCARPLPRLESGSALRVAPVVDARAQSRAIAGQVKWVDPADRGLLASMAAIASAATISLIELDTGNTAASTVTATDGAFSLDLAGWVPEPDRPYALEAIKGLGLDGKPNQAGAPLARLRTVVQISDGAWTSLTGPTIFISRSTTAVSAIAGLEGFDTPKIQALLGKIAAGSPDTYTPTADLSAADYQAVWGLVDAALALNQDPIRAIARSSQDGAFIRLERSIVITDVSSLSGRPGDVITLYGYGFDPTAANNVVAIGGVPVSSVQVNATGTRLQVTVPAGAAGGAITVSVGAMTVSVPGPFRPAGGIIETVAGTTVPLPGTLATEWPLSGPQGVAFDGQGRAFVASGTQVFRIDPDGTIAVVAGNGTAGFSGDGGAALEASLSPVGGVAVDGAGNLFIADSNNNRIRKVSAAGTITTVAGNGSGGYSGDGGVATAAKLYTPIGIAVDGAGNLFFADYGNRRIRKVSAAGTITTVAGNGSTGYSGDGGAATTAKLWSPSGVTVDGAGNLFIADHYRVRR